MGFLGNSWGRISDYERFLRNDTLIYNLNKGFLI